MDAVDADLAERRAQRRDGGRAAQLAHPVLMREQQLAWRLERPRREQRHSEVVVRYGVHRRRYVDVRQAECAAEPLGALAVHLLEHHEVGAPERPRSRQQLDGAVDLLPPLEVEGDDPQRGSRLAAIGHAALVDGGRRVLVVARRGAAEAAREQQGRQDEPTRRRHPTILWDRPGGGNAAAVKPRVPDGPPIPAFRSPRGAWPACSGRPRRRGSARPRPTAAA